MIIEFGPELMEFAHRCLKVFEYSVVGFYIMMGLRSWR
jgi:hypothetical protein